MTAQEYLLDTLKYYTVDPVARRCMSGPFSCYYSPVTAKKDTTEGCAVGRHMTPENKLKADNIESNSIILQSTVNYSYLHVHHPELLPDWMKALSQFFVGRVQMLHDAAANWDEKGLTFMGRAEVKQLVEQNNFDKELFKEFMPLPQLVGE